MQFYYEQPHFDKLKKKKIAKSFLKDDIQPIFEE